MSSAKQLRVLALIDQADGTGGAERFAVGLAEHLPSERFESWVCGTRSGPNLADGEMLNGVRYLTLGRRSLRDLHRFLPLVRLMRRERFDIIHSHMFGSNLWAALFGRACGVPVILAHEHNWSYSGQRYRRWIDRWVIGGLASRFIAVSQANRDRMVRLEHVHPAKITVLPTAYIPHRDNPGLDLRAELGLPRSSPLVAVAAHLREEKALEVLIEAHATVVRRVPDAHLIIIGQGPTRALLEASAAENGVTERVRFLGARDDVSSILAQVDVGALSSDWEGMPLFVLECMFTATPVVATAVGGLVDMIDDGRTGRLVPPRNPDALGGAIADMLLDDAARTRMAAAAGEHVAELSMERVSARFVALYEELYAAAEAVAPQGRGRLSPI